MVKGNDSQLKMNSDSVYACVIYFMSHFFSLSSKAVYSRRNNEPVLVSASAIVTAVGLVTAVISIAVGAITAAVLLMLLLLLVLLSLELLLLLL